VFIGFEDGSLQLIQFMQSNSIENPLYDTKLQATPVQVTLSPWTAPSDVGAALCAGISYDGTILLSGHASGKIIQWDTGRRSFAAELNDLNAPVTNLIMLSPFPEKRMTKAVSVVKPKLGEGNYSFTAQLTGSMGNNRFEHAVGVLGIPSEMLEDAISRFSRPVESSSSGDEKLRRDNEDLWKIINEQRALQKKTWDKYTKLKSGGG
jgi:pre-rRNA-processing protein IPI3